MTTGLQPDRCGGSQRMQRLIRRIDLLSLRILLTIASEGGHFARAAARENIAPSAVSKRMQVLEETTGMQLFDRKSQHTDLTAAGRVLVSCVHDIFGLLARMDEELEDFSNGVRGRVRIASTEAAIVEFLAEEIRVFSRQFPNVDVELKVDSNPNTLKATMTGEADLAIYALTDDVAEFEADSAACRTDSLVALLPSAHPMAGAASLAFTDLLGEDLIAMSPGTSLMSQLRHEAERAGRPLRIKHEVTSLEVARSLVRAGLGVTVQPDGLMIHEDHGRIRAIPLTDAWAKREMRVAARPGRELSLPARALRTQLISAFCSQADVLAADSGNNHHWSKQPSAPKSEPVAISRPTRASATG